MKNAKLLQNLQSELGNDSDFYWPLEVSISTEQTGAENIDAQVTLKLDGERRTFNLQAEGDATPRSIRNTLAHSRDESSEGVPNTLLAVPHLSKGIVELLRAAESSALDLNGNYFIRADEFSAVRLDRENQYPRSRGIKNVYRGTSSLVGRFLLHKPGPFDEVQKIHQGILDRGGRISLSTVSKALNGLADDLFIEKTRDKIELLRPVELLDRLRDEYREPRVEQSFPIKLREGPDGHTKALNDLVVHGPWVWSGESSAEHYTAAPPPSVRTAYADPSDIETGALVEYRNERFYDCELVATDDDFVFFNTADDHWADDVETYLQLASGDERARDIAATLETRILRRLEDA